jgi:hypothetical protein
MINTVSTLLLTPLIPLSNRIIKILELIFIRKGGEYLRGGLAPSLFNSPLQPVKTQVSTIIQAGEGIKG